jgi:hypothetical protein
MNETFIYVKQSPNGLFYLGKTERNPYNYMGSGTIWKKHIKKYNFTKKDIKTFILHKTNDKDDLIRMGEYYSKLFNIIENKNWANLRIENGDGGDTSMSPNYKKPPIMSGEKSWMKTDRAKKLFSDMFKGDNNPAKRPEVREKIRQKAIGRKASIETKQKLSESRIGENNSFYGKKHKDVVKSIMKDKAKGRYTIDWFVSKFGEADGKLKYEEQRKNNVLKFNKGKANLLKALTKEYTCPHCNKVGKGSNMKRYHFNNCKFLKND